MRLAAVTQVPGRAAQPCARAPPRGRKHKLNACSAARGRAPPRLQHSNTTHARTLSARGGRQSGMAHAAMRAVRVQWHPMLIAPQPSTLTSTHYLLHLDTTTQLWFVANLLAPCRIFEYWSAGRLAPKVKHDRGKGGSRQAFGQGVGGGPSCKARLLLTLLGLKVKFQTLG